MTAAAAAETAPLFAALARATARAQAVGKDATNTFHKYNYASAEGILAEARAALSAEELAVIPVSVGPDPAQPKHGWQGEGADAWIETPRRILSKYLLVHSSGGAHLFESSCPVIPEKGRPEDKAEFGAKTEDLAYALRALLLLPRVDEKQAPAPSARDDTDKPAPRRAAPPPKPARAVTAVDANGNTLATGETFDPQTGEVAPMITLPQHKALGGWLGALGIKTREGRLIWLTKILEREINSSDDLTRDEASKAISAARSDAKRLPKAAVREPGSDDGAA